MKNYAFLSIWVFVVFFSCDKKPDSTVEYTIKDVEFVFEGPLFEGSNEAQAQVAFSPEDVLGEFGVTRDNIQDIKIKRVVLDITSHETFNMAESIMIQLVGGDLGLTTAAHMSFVPKGMRQVEPQITDNISLVKLKDIKEFYWVNDVNLAEGTEDDVTLKGEIVFLIDIKK